MTYYLQGENKTNWNEETMNRLDKIRSAIPFCFLYKGKNIFIPTELSSTNNHYLYDYSDSSKQVSAENLHFKTDIEKNRTIHHIIEANYQVKTWYDFLEKYYQARNTILTWIEYALGFEKSRKGANYNMNAEDLKGLPNKTPELLRDIKAISLFKNCQECFNDFIIFIGHLSKYLSDNKNESAKRLLFINYNNFLFNLPYMQNFFVELEKFTPNYFDFSFFIEKENKLYLQFKSRLASRIENSKYYQDLNSTELLFD